MATRLEQYQKKYEILADGLKNIGFLSDGSVGQISARCGKSNCRCKADPPQLHGPYWQWSTSVGGKTVSKRLNDEQAELYREWINNRHRFDEIVHQMKIISAKAANIELKAAQNKPARKR